MQWVMEKGNWYEGLLNRFKRELGFVSAELDTIHHFVGEEPSIATVKYNGELTAAVMDVDCGATYNRYGRIRWNYPTLGEFLFLAESAGFESVIAFGELYAVSEDGRPLPLNQVMSIIKRPETSERELQIRLAIFDIYSLDDTILYGKTSYEDRFLIAHTIFRGGAYVHPAAGREFRTGEPVVDELWKRHVLEENYEGIVVRTEERAIKIKPKFGMDLAVVGIFEGRRRLEGTLGGLVVAFMDSDGRFLFASRVGTGFTDQERDDLWRDLRPMVVSEADGGSRAGFGQSGNLLLPPLLVVEVIATDFVSRDVDSMLWDLDSERYTDYRVDSRAGWTLQSPRFKQIRTDKTINPEDLRLEQVPLTVR